MLDHPQNSNPSSFTVGAARCAGWTRAQVDAPHLEAPFHGVRMFRAFDPASESREGRHRRAAIAYASTVMADDAFLCHVTAADVWGAPLPSRAISDDIHVGVMSPARLARGRGVRGHEVHPRLVRVVVHPELGVRIASPASTWAMLGRALRDRYDLVAVADALVRTPQHPDDPAALATLAQLEAAAFSGRRVGINALRAALPLVRTGASSRPETWTRLTLVDAGLPEPALAHEVFDAAGQLIARVDLAYPELRIAIEYEGEHHLTDSAQWTKDIARYEQLAAAGWTVIRVTKDELFRNPASLVSRVRTARARAS